MGEKRPTKFISDSGIDMMCLCRGAVKAINSTGVYHRMIK